MQVEPNDPELKKEADNSPSPNTLQPNSREWMLAYYAAILQCKIRYKQMVWNDVGTFGGQAELLAFLDEFTPEVPLPKLCRWLGYIQGVLIEKGITTTEEERVWTRPLFRPLDFSNA